LISMFYQLGQLLTHKLKKDILIISKGEINNG